MLFRLFRSFSLADIPRELVLLAFINGLSGMALNGAAVFGMLAILSGTTFLHGMTGLGFYVAIYGSATFVGYLTVCRYAALLGLKANTILFTVFATHATGFIGAAFVHPICLALSSGLGLGMFYAVFMLKNLNSLHDHARDRYATINGIIQQCTTLIAPFLGVGMLYLGQSLGFHNVFFPTFLTFAVCVLAAIPLIRRMPDVALPCSIALPLKAIADRRHLPAIGLFLTAISCESLLYPLLLIASFALFGKVIDSGWFSSAITVLATLSLILTHYVRVPDRRWQLLGGCLIGIGLGFLAFDLSFSFQTLLLAGACFAVLRVNYQAVWFAFSTRVIEREWGSFGKNQALVLSEIFVFAARLGIAALLLLCGTLDLSLTQSLWVLTGFYLLSTCAVIGFARRLEKKTDSQEGRCV